MQYPAALESAVLVRRYKRFLADVTLDGGQETTIYCPNTGSMKHCADPGVPIWFSRTDNPKRKYQLTWEQGTDSWGNRVGLRSVLANTLVAEAIDSGLLSTVERDVALSTGGVPWLTEISQVHAEWRWACERVRFDYAIDTAEGAQVLVEVKSVTLAQSDGQGFFPDAKTARGLKQVKALEVAQQQGKQALLVYCVQNSGITSVSLAQDIDPDYARAVSGLQAAGGRILALGCELDEHGITVVRGLPFCGA